MSGAHPVTPAPDTARILDAVRMRRPLVHCLTNSVTVSRVADALAAVGARPVMASALEEVEEMASHADGLLLNLGTPDDRRWSAARSAAGVARQRRVPIVVDPVGCGATSWRTAQSRALVSAAPPDIIRGSAPEVAVLANLPPPPSRQHGVAAQDSPELDPVALAASAAAALGCVVVVTGRSDGVSDAQRRIAHTTGVPVLDHVVGAGDVLSALICACAAVETDRLCAAWAGLSIFSAAAGAANRNAEGPGTFWSFMLDALGK